MTTYELPPEPVTLWRCVRCGKWSHAKRKPKLHQRFVMSPGLGDVIISHETGEDGGYFIQCGPFEEWVARPAGGGGDDLVAALRAVLDVADYWEALPPVGGSSAEQWEFDTLRDAGKELRRAIEEALS